MKTPLTNWTNVFTVSLLILKSLTLVIKVLIFFYRNLYLLLNLSGINKIFFYFNCIMKRSKYHWNKKQSQSIVLYFHNDFYVTIMLGKEEFDI